MPPWAFSRIEQKTGANKRRGEQTVSMGGWGVFSLNPLQPAQVAPPTSTLLQCWSIGWSFTAICIGRHTATRSIDFAPVNLGSSPFEDNARNPRPHLSPGQVGCGTARHCPVRVCDCSCRGEIGHRSQKEEKPWVRLAGRLDHLHKETARINRIMKVEFEEIEPEDWRSDPRYQRSFRGLRQPCPEALPYSTTFPLQPPIDRDRSAIRSKTAPNCQNSGSVAMRYRQ
jgi:hypothetical protein